MTRTIEARKMGKLKMESFDGFKPIPGFPGYQASEDGIIIGQFGRAKKPQLAPSGRFRVNVQLNGKARKLNVGEAILMTYGGEVPPGRVCMHIDGDYSNNHVSNLKWARYEELGDFERKMKEVTDPKSYRLAELEDERDAAVSGTLRELVQEPESVRPMETPDLLPLPHEVHLWLDYIRRLNQQLFRSNFDSAEIKIVLVFLNLAIQHNEEPKTYLSEPEIVALTTMTQSKVKRALKTLLEKNILLSPDDTPAGCYFGLNVRGYFFQFRNTNLLKVWGRDYEEYRSLITPDHFDDLPPAKRAAIEHVYLPPVLSKDTWLTAEQVAEICCVSVDFVHKHSKNTKSSGPETLRCLRKAGKGEKRFEWPEVDRWRRAIFYLPKSTDTKSYEKEMREASRTYEERHPSRTYFTRSHWR